LIGIVEKEAAETQYWLELCEEIADGELRNCAIFRFGIFRIPQFAM